MIRSSIIFASTAVVILACHGLSPAEEIGFRTSLFNGENLDGWHVSNCSVGVEAGALVIQDGNGFVRTDHSYSDFVLELKWRARKAIGFDSGIYFRSTLPGEGKPWPDRYQINLKQGDEGNVIGVDDAKSNGLAKVGDWNAFKLTVIGKKASLEINGKHAWTTEKIESLQGYIGIQVEVPLGGQYEFKDIFVTEIGHKSLFDGTTFAGWEGAGEDASKCWKVEDGMVVCTGQKGPWLRSLRQFGDFNMRLDYKLKAAGNSGVYVRVPKDGNHHGEGAGVEIQILDDAAEKYKDLKPYQYTGSVYAIAPAEKHVGRPAGTWNSMEIDCRGYEYRIIHNGIVIISVNTESFPELKQRLVSGYLGLQNHSEEVWFRNVRLKEYPNSN